MKSNKQKIDIGKIIKVITLFLSGLVMAIVILGLFFVRGSMELGEKCPKCVGGIFTANDLFTSSNLIAGLIFAFTFSLLMVIIISIYTNDK